MPAAAAPTCLPLASLEDAAARHCEHCRQPRQSQPCSGNQSAAKERDPITQPSLLIGPVQDELQTRCSAAFDLADVDVRADDAASMIAVFRCGIDHVAARCILPVLHASAEHQRAEMFPQAPCI